MSNVQISDLPTGTVDLTDVIHISETGLDRKVTVQSLFDLVEGTLQHQDITGSGTNTHANIDTHITNAAIHASISDGTTTTSSLWSSTKTASEIAGATYDASDIISGTFSNSRIAVGNVTQHVASIDHDATLNFVGNEHINHTSVTITGGEGLSGGGDISANRTLDLDVNSLTEDLTPAAGDFLATYDVSASGHKKIAISTIAGAAYIPTGANVGVGGVGPFKEVSGSELRFYNINAGDTTVTVSLDAVNSEIDIIVNPANINVSALAGYSTLARTDVAPTFAAGINVTGNIAVTGTVDGRDVGTDGTKLDTVATNANNYVHPNHTGDVLSTGDGATILDTAAISAKTELTTGVVGTDELLVNDSGALKRMDISVLAELLLYRTGAGAKSVTGNPYIPETTLTDGTTVTWNFNTDNVEAVVTLGGNRTLAMSNVPPAGACATLRVVQDGTGSRTLAFGTGIDAGTVGTATLSTAAGKEDLLSFRSNGTVMHYRGMTGGYA